MEELLHQEAQLLKDTHNNETIVKLWKDIAGLRIQNHKLTDALEASNNRVQ